MKKTNGPKVLLFDIETRPIEAYVWGLFDQNIGIDQIINDWGVISWSAKWQGDPNSKIMYQDLRNKNKYNDRNLLKNLWKLLDEADVAITQNGKAFDNKKVNARFAILGFKPPASYKNADTLIMAKKSFKFTSNKLAYLSEKNPTSNLTKMKSKKFPGFDLWKECLNGNIEAWKEMERYNKRDVLALEKLYKWLAPWWTPINLALYTDSLTPVCSCGNTHFEKLDRFAYTTTGKFFRFRCTKCGSEMRSKINLLSKEKRTSLRQSISRD